MSQDKTFTIVIKPGGDLRFIYNDDLRFLTKLGKCETKRASHVEPVDHGNELRWEADMSPSNGPKLGPFYFRKRALVAEKLWIEENAL